MEYMTLAQMWWWIHSQQLDREFYSIRSKGRILKITSNTASSFCYSASFNHLIPYNLKWRVAGINQPCEYVLGRLKKKILPSWGNLTYNLSGSWVRLTTCAFCLLSWQPDLASWVPIQFFFNKKNNLKFLSTNYPPVATLCTLHAVSHLIFLTKITL